ncbi:GTPase-activating protein [Oryzomonas sagensis]|uniref:GTPase-activating protein n=1 Tax=Oryzomonas sagensis TaxID=2603857 RepID=A0ABQ6TL36_9BACT|nr:GTPase-activating protein [Oryzomonas sagensis]KAB0668815.1 GTPase-activating protein [Oryzomonas sagensis]
MRFLPKANPLYEKIPARKVVPSEVLNKLAKGGFSGYLRYTDTDFEADCIFIKGALICVSSSDGEKERTGFEAFTLLFDKILSSGGEINIYRMTADLAVCAHALLLGGKLLHGSEVRQIDMKETLAQLRSQGLNGVVRFYTAERSAMIFYKDGQPIGYYHDEARTVEASPEESRTVAALPGALVDVCSTKPMEELLRYNLLKMVNLDKLWEAAKARQTILPKETHFEQQGAGAKAGLDDGRLQALVEDLKEIAAAYLSKEGRVAVERGLQKAGGNRILSDDEKSEAFITLFEGEARRIDSNTRIDEMIDLMRSEIAGRLAV